MTQGYGTAPGPSRSPHYGAAITGLIIGTAGMLLMLAFSRDYSACQSFLGQIAQGTDAATRASCSGAAIAHWAGLLALIGGAVTLAAGIIAMLAGASTQPQPSTPLPWQDIPCARCGAPATAHTQAGCPACMNCGQPAAAHTAGQCPASPHPPPPTGHRPGVGQQ